MDVLFFFLIISFLFLIILGSLKKYFQRTVKKQLSSVFTDTLELHGGTSLLSFRSINGIGVDKSLEAKHFNVEINFLGFFQPGRTQFVNISCQKLSINLQNFKFDRKKPIRRKSLERWILQKFGELFAALLVRSAKLEVKNLKITINKFTFVLADLNIDFKRNSDIFRFSTNIQEFEFHYNFPSFRIPNIEFVLTSKVDMLRYLLSHQINTLILSLRQFKFSYEDATITLEEAPISFTSSIDQNVYGDLIMKKIQMMIPLFDLHTKSLEITTSGILVSRNNFETSSITIKRMNQTLFYCPYCRYQRDHFFLGQLEVNLTLTLFIDVGLIVRFAKEKLQIASSQIKSDPYAKFRDITASSPQGAIQIFLSDKHVIKADFYKIQFKDMTVYAKQVYGFVVFGGDEFQFASGTKGSARIEPPKIDVKFQEAEVLLSNGFAEGVFIQEVVGIFKFLQGHFRGGGWEAFTDQPPTRIQATLSISKGVVRLERSPLANSVMRANEAKRFAFEELRIRQKKALQMVEVQGRRNFNQEEFDRESHRLFMELYRKALVELKPMDENVFRVDIVNLECGMNGFDVPNRADALRRMCEISSEASDEVIGRIGGASYFGKVEHANWNEGNFGTIMNGDMIDLKGFFFTAQKRCRTADEYYKFQIKCDEGSEVFEIPLECAKSVVFLSAFGDADTVSYRWGPAFLEAAHDIKLGTDRFRRRHYQIKWLQFIDHCRFRTRLTWNVKVKNAIYDNNDHLDAYNPIPAQQVVATSAIAKFDGYNYDICAEQIHGRIMENGQLVHILTMYSPDVRFQFRCINPDEPESGRPLFIPILSTEMADPTKDPFEKFRTVFFELHFNVTFPYEKMGVINLDHIQAVIDRYMTRRMEIEKFHMLPMLIWKFQPWPKFRVFDMNITLPKLLLTMMKETVSIKILGDPINLHINTSKDNCNIVTPCNVQIQGLLNARPWFSFAVNDLTVGRQNEVVQISLRKAAVEVTYKFLSTLTEIPITFPRAGGNKAEIPAKHTPTDLYNYFTKTVMMTDIDLIELKLIVDDDRAVSLSISKFIAELRECEEKVKLISFQFDQLIIDSITKVPLVKIVSPHFYMATASNRSTWIALLSLVEISVSQEEFDFLVPLVMTIFNMYAVKFQTPTNTQEVEVKKESLFEYFMQLRIEGLNANLLNQDRSHLVSVILNVVHAETQRKEDLSEVVKFEIEYATATHPNGDNTFKNILSTVSAQDPLFTIQLYRTRPLMRCPVFDLIDINFNSFITNIDINFIFELAAFFKTTDDIHVFDLVEEEPEAEQSAEDLMTTVNVASAGDSGNVFFCRVFRFNSFDAQLSLRLPRDSVFTEFLDRPFHYSGIDMEDIFGTKQQLMALVKKNLKWAVIKALPKFFFQKQKQPPKEKDPK